VDMENHEFPDSQSNLDSSELSCGGVISLISKLTTRLH
jgi:hypothetical protein